MAITYDRLKQQIIAYSRKNADDAQFGALVPLFVNMGMERIYREAGDMGMEKLSDAFVFTERVNTVDKPAGWSQTLSFYYGTPDNAEINKTFLFERSWEFCQAWLAEGVAVAGRPQFYADDPSDPYGKFFMVPAPDQAYRAKIVFTPLPPYLPPNQEDNPAVFNNNWVFQRAPSLIFYASYLEALTYMGKNEDIPTFESFYNRALQSINLQTRKRSVDRTADREKT